MESLRATPQSSLGYLLLEESDFSDDWSWMLEDASDSFAELEPGEESNQSVNGGLVGFHKPTKYPITVFQNIRFLDFPLNEQTLGQDELGLELDDIDQEISMEVPEFGTSRASRCLQYPEEQELEYSSCEVVIVYECFLVKTSVITFSSDSTNWEAFESITQEIIQEVDQRMRENNSETCRPPNTTTN